MECFDLHDWGYHIQCARVHYVDYAEKCFLCFILYQEVEICKNDSIGY
jgi:hypothetical protein